MPKVQAGSTKKRCHHCNLEVSASKWAKHLRTKGHISKQSAHVRRAVSDSDEDFQLASPTVVAGPSASPSSRNDEVLQIIKAKNELGAVRAKKAGSVGRSTIKSDTGGEKDKRDKASTNFLITAHRKRKYVYARCMYHWSKCYVIGREFNNGGLVESVIFIYLLS